MFSRCACVLIELHCFGFSYLLCARIPLFWLEIKVEGFVTTDNAGKKSYVKSKILKGSVQVGTLIVDMVLSSLSSAVSWSSNQTATLWFF